MGWRSESRSSNGWSRQSTSVGSSCGDDSVAEDVELAFVCNGVPVLTMQDASVFHENASWMLQSALSAGGKADALYEHCYDEDILRECRRLGLRDEEVGLARLRRKDLLHVKAVGTTGKRSVMLAMVVALGLEDGLDMAGLWKELRDYQLDRPFVALIRRGKERAASALPSQAEAGEGDEDEGEQIRAALEREGVELQLIGKKVPVLGLAKGSVFQENASWLLQIATGSYGRADAVYDYCSDRGVVAECRRLGLSDHEVGLARLKKQGAQHVQAVGTCGKRSVMLALVAALVIQGEVEPEQLLKDAAASDSRLESPVRALLRAASRLAGRSSSEPRGDAGWASWSGWSGKRKWGGDCGYDHDQGGPRQGTWSHRLPSRSSKKKASARPGGPDEKSLDKQLDDYWGDDRD